MSGRRRVISPDALFLIVFDQPIPIELRFLLDTLNERARFTILEEV